MAEFKILCTVTVTGHLVKTIEADSEAEALQKAKKSRADNCRSIEWDSAEVTDTKTLEVKTYPDDDKYIEFANVIADAIRIGREREEEVLKEMGGDSGTCNMDAPILLLHGKWDIERLIAKLKTQNVRGFKDGPDTLFLCIHDRSQGYPRTANCEKVAEILRTKGHDCYVKYVMD